LQEETRRGMQTLALYQKFQSRADKIKNDLLEFVLGYPITVRQLSEKMADQYGVAS